MLPTNQSIEHKLETSRINVIEAGILQTASPKLNLMNLGKSIEHNQQQRRNLIQKYHELTLNWKLLGY